MKIFYNSKIAKITTFMSGFKTIMLFGAVFTEKSELSARSKAHEAVHVEQYQTLFMSGLVMAVVSMFMLFAFDIRSWWMLCLVGLPLFSYYIWYGLEFLVRYAITRDSDDAYRNICFESEAFDLQEDYVLDCNKRRKASSFSFLIYL